MAKITPVLMSGGAGTRLWPISRRARPKQFHALIGGKGGGERTLIQDTVLRFTGGCLCGAIRYAVTGPLPAVGMCHCSKCRRASGAASNAVLNVRADRVEWLSGQDHWREFRTPSGWGTFFCPTCGCPAPHFLSLL